MAEKSNESVRTGTPSPERLAAKHQQALFGDYFQILEVERDTDALRVARAVVALTEEFNPERIGSLSPDDQVKLRLVAAVLRDAALVLGDAGLRVAYARHQKGTR